jgi:hypothetical protein
MTRSLYLIVISLLLLGCAHTVDIAEKIPHDINLYGGDAAEAVQSFNQLMAKCTELQNKKGEEYNSRSLAIWHWNFWTSFVGGIGVAASASYSASDKPDQAKNVSITSSILVSLSIVTKEASQVAARLTEVNVAYSERKGVIEHANRLFQELEPNLRDPNAARQKDAVERLKNLNVFLENSIK